MSWSTAYDRQLAGIGHYQLYPELYPWIGREFHLQPTRILVLGESHYLDPRSAYHHDAAAWYAGLDIQAKDDRHWIKTRTIIANGIKNRWKEKSKLIYRNIEGALHSAGVSVVEEASPFQGMAFMNYFQRPAQVSGASIRVTELDRKHSAAILNSVVDILAPQILIFCSVLAGKEARAAGVLNPLAHRHIRFAVTPHPASRWWHTPMRKYQGKSGKEMFIHALQAA